MKNLRICIPLLLLALTIVFAACGSVESPAATATPISSPVYNPSVLVEWTAGDVVNRVEFGEWGYYQVFSQPTTLTRLSVNGIAPDITWQVYVYQLDESRETYTERHLADIKGTNLTDLKLENVDAIVICRGEPFTLDPKSLANQIIEYPIDIQELRNRRCPENPLPALKETQTAEARTPESARAPTASPVRITATPMATIAPTATGGR